MPLTLKRGVLLNAAFFSSGWKDLPLPQPYVSLVFANTGRPRHPDSGCRKPAL
jgi:hypothetical protein